MKFLICHSYKPTSLCECVKRLMFYKKLCRSQMRTAFARFRAAGKFHFSFCAARKGRVQRGVFPLTATAFTFYLREEQKAAHQD